MSKKNIFQGTISVCFFAMICCLLWGSAFPCIKLGYDWFNIKSNEMANQILFAGYRFTIAGIMVILVGSIIEKRILFPKSLKSWERVGIVSLFQTFLQYVFYYIGLAHTTGVKVSIVIGSNVFVALIISCLIFKLETLSIKKILGCIIGFLGIIIINSSGENFFGNFNFWGEGLVFISTIAYAFSSVFMKKFSKYENPIEVSGYQFFLGGIVMSICGLIMGGKVTITDTKSLIMLIYLAFISAGAYTLWSILLKHNPVSQVTVFGFMNPIFGSLLSALILNEKEQIFNVKSLISLCLVCIGIFIVNFSKDLKSVKS